MEVVAIVLVLLTALFALGVHWILACASGVWINPLSMLGLRVRKTPTDKIVNGLVPAKKAGINLSFSEMEGHQLSGGNVVTTVNAVIAAKHAKIELPYMKAAAIDLAGKDVLAFVEAEAKK